MEGSLSFGNSSVDQLYQEELELEYEVYTKNSENPRLQEIKQQKHEIMTDEILVKELSLKKSCSNRTQFGVDA